MHKLLVKKGYNVNPSTVYRDITSTNKITKDHNGISVNSLLNLTYSVTILNARSKLQYYDRKLKDIRLRATIKIGKIE